MRKRYAEYLEKYGFSYLLEDPLYNMPETGKPEEEAATMEETPETAQKAIVKPEKPEAEQDSTATPEKPYTGNIEEFSRIYSRVYSVLYDHLQKSIPGQRIFYKNAISYFDNVLNMNSGGLLSAFIKYRKDFISSDREAAAFSIAYWIINGKTRDIPQNLLTMFIPLTPGRNAIKEHTSAYKKICYTVKRSRNISHITPYKPPEELRHGNYAIMAENVYIRHITQDRHIITMLPAWKSCICCGSQKTKRPYIDSSWFINSPVKP